MLIKKACILRILVISEDIEPCYSYRLYSYILKRCIQSPPPMKTSHCKTFYSSDKNIHSDNDVQSEILELIACKITSIRPCRNRKCSDRGAHCMTILKKKLQKGLRLSKFHGKTKTKYTVSIRIQFIRI